MRRVVSPIGVRTALATGLVVLSLTPAAFASRYACGGSISAPDTARRGSSFTVTATAVEGEHFKVWLIGGEGDSLLASGAVAYNGNFTVTVTVPANFSTGGATVVMDMTSPSTCDYGSGITILSKLIVIPGITITIPPALTTTTAAQQVTTTTAAPQVATTTSTDPTSTTAELVETTTSVTAGAAATTSSTSEALDDSASDSSSTSLVAAVLDVDSGGGQPWSAWITGGMVGLLLGAAGMLVALRKGVLKL